MQHCRVLHCISLNFATLRICNAHQIHNFGTACFHMTFYRITKCVQKQFLSNLGGLGWGRGRGGGGGVDLHRINHSAQILCSETAQVIDKMWYLKTGCLYAHLNCSENPTFGALLNWIIITAQWEGMHHLFNEPCDKTIAKNPYG